MPIIKKYSYINGGIEFSDIIEPNMITGQKIKNRNYIKEGDIISYTTSLINAIDIDWNNAYLPASGKHIITTGEMLHEVDNIITKTDNVDNRVAYIENLIETGQIPGGGGSIETAAGIPIYTKDYIEELGDNLPDNYISIPSPDELDNKIDDPIQYSDTGNGYYLDILFSTIRQLQAEVAKLRNAFKYGIYSYNDKETAMSNVMSDNAGIEASEPLWAVDENELSEVTQFDCQLNTAHTLQPKTAVEVGKDLLKITGTATWTDSIGSLNEVEDNKIFIYLTTTGKNIKFILKNIDIDDNYLTVDLDNLNISSTILNKYNIMFAVNRAMPNPDNEEDTALYGNNFIWMAVSPYGADMPCAEGFWLNDHLYDSEKSLGSKENTRYVPYSIEFNDCTIYKFNMYSRYQNFTHNVESFVSDDTDYRYRAAHITIRSVETYAVLTEIKDQLPDNELIFVEGSNNLYIKSNNKLIKIGAGGQDDGSDTPIDEGMTEQEMLDKLTELGIVYNNDKGELQINDVDYIKFIHNGTGKQFEYRTTAYGELKGEEIRTDTIESKLENISSSAIADDFGFYRGFAAQLFMGEYSLDHTRIADNKDWGINSDRIKISAIYAPLKTDVVYGCTHAYIELANSSDKDFNLEGCYLHYTKANDNDSGFSYYHLKLKGYIPAGGTYLIRCKKYAEPTDKNTFINVDSYDIEWYDNGELLDLSMVDETALENKTKIYEFCLTYGLPDITQANGMYQDYTGEEKDKAAFVYAKYFIDGISINKYGVWSHAPYAQTKNSLYKDTFELDPAKQAFNGLTTHDSSRQRWGNTATDYQIVSLNNEYIEFPKTNEKYPVSNYTPKASYQHKNVCTDKTKLDTDKPNMVTCSFGKNVYTTRCFNWVSVGLFDEYIWIYDNNDNLLGKFESYKHIDTEIEQQSTFPRRREWPVDVNNIVYSSVDTPRFVGRFPADNSFYTSHKCIIDITDSSVDTPVTYKYIIGRSDKNGNPDPNHTVSGYTFTLYPESYTPWVYQTTDQQGFHWIEYQVWGAAANKLDDVILNDCENNNIMPVLVNTGDMTQSGARINEWLDYYNGGIKLFKHLEQMNCVGNNDLCGTNPSILGTGDDTGKSNSFFFHIFYCYEVCPITREDNNETVYPIINGKYVPSLYYVDFVGKRIVMCNSEITMINCRDWFMLRYNDGSTIYPVNIYTGYTITGNSSTLEKYAADELGFTPIYTFMYHYTDNSDGKKIIVGCHEMPYTVITHAALVTSVVGQFRSCSPPNGTSLVGSHMNQIVATETGAGIYWFSRLLEFRGIKLCFGGHKHTYMLTYPVQERYKWTDTNGELHDSLTDIWPMDENLKNEAADNINNRPIKWIENGTNYTKFPYTFRNDEGQPPQTSGRFYPYTYVDTTQAYDDHAVIYLMCQATGYKLTSNKELPSNAQKFSQIIPQTNNQESGDKPSKEQRVPMFAVLKFNDNNIECEIVRIQNIFSGTTFTQLTYDKGNKMNLNYLTVSDTDAWGNWNTSEPNVEKTLITIDF